MTDLMRKDRGTGAGHANAAGCSGARPIVTIDEEALDALRRRTGLLRQRLSPRQRDRRYGREGGPGAAVIVPIGNSVEAVLEFFGDRRFQRRRSADSRKSCASTSMRRRSVNDRSSEQRCGLADTQAEGSMGRRPSHSRDAPSVFATYPSTGERRELSDC